MADLGSSLNSMLICLWLLLLDGMECPKPRLNGDNLTTMHMRWQENIQMLRITP